jgi:hypothetical protein
MTDERSEAKDWSGNWRGLLLIWGLPTAIVIASGNLAPMLRGTVWTLMLLWMGAACIANARRCARTHCRFTGPFLLLMAALVAGYASGLLPLGPNGWNILSGLILFGFAAIWWGSERIWGTFSR